MFYQTRRYLIVEEYDVTTALKVINQHQGFFSNNNKIVEGRGKESEPTKWLIRFYASDREWGRMVKDLNELGKIDVKVNPGGTADLYFNMN